MRERELDGFYADVEASHLTPLWRLPGMPESPRPRAVPFVWRWNSFAKLAARSGDLVPIDRGGDRRVLVLTNPGLGGRAAATGTLLGAVQYLLPGETAPAHRHTPAALRFVLDGAGVWTGVDGDPVAMDPGDLVLTPSWNWHEHHNPGAEPMLWLDVLDLPLVDSLDAVFYEDGPDDSTLSAPRGPSRSERLFSAAPGVVPVGPRPDVAHSPLLAYRYAETDAALDNLLAVNRSDHAAVRFTDPTTGRDVMPTIRCEMHRITAGNSGPRVRETGSSIWTVHAGRVQAAVAEDTFDLERGDVLAVPSWCAHTFTAHDTATLLRVSDAPVIEALGLSRREESTTA
ncbi:cupin domain-containing protein [Actinokineospora sp.]|uniref:cupin domain-containing protein n=1 Tax=Actinokineospora sp. TaxID=1872133 RepID=UPI0040381672